MTNTENVSEKRKRGRPMTHAGMEARTDFSLPGNAHSVRGRMNSAKAALALVRLMGEGHEHMERYRWLYDESKSKKIYVYRSTIMAELARIPDVDTMRAVADHICKLKPKTREAVAMIRRWRLKQSGEGDALNLANEWITHLNDYLRRYPKTTTEQINDAVRTLQNAVTK